MERSLILPLSIAAALHAGVLFGFHRGPVPVVAKAVPSVLLKPIEMPPPDKDVDEVLPPSEEKATKSTAELVPRSPEPPTAPDPTRIEMKPVPPVINDGPIKDLKNVTFDPTAAIDRSGNIISAINLDNPPRARVRISPPYPVEAVHTGLSGKVLVEFVVDETGHVLDPRIVSSTNPAFDETTLRTLPRWRFEPGKKNGRAVRFRMALPLEFNLSEN
jgi:protein TonB